MADHLNINEPSHRSDDRWAQIIATEKLKIELEWANKRADKYRDDLDAIFTRIGRGDTSELRYENGYVITITALAEGDKANG